MKNYTRLLTLLLVLILMLQATASTAFAFVPVDVSDNELYASVQPSSYSSQYNSGKRDVVATTLSGTSASDYYTGSYDFDVLSEKSSTQILASLRELLSSTHTKTSSYDDCKNMAGKTDCEEENGKVLLLYTSVYSTVNAANSGWNREHVWPKSLGNYSTSGPGADLHHIRPTDNRVNSCRSNLKYGNVTGGKTATGGNAASGVNGGTYGSYFEPLDNVKGDVARICLYMYVRYGGMSAYTCSSITKVFQSVDVLLEWCEMDPVDTWELGRNEVVEAYQGNRNVFIDYPEYAWLIFGKSVPSDMETPSGEASNGSLGGNGGGATTPDPDPKPEPNPATDKEILDAAYALAPGASLDGTYTLTGVITELDTYNNPTIVVGSYTSQPIYCFRLVDSRFVIGATITVTGTITNYNGLIEFKNCTLENIVLPSVNPDPEPNPDPNPDPEPNPDPNPNPDPEPAPGTLVESFKTAVNELAANTGAALYEKLCDAVTIYGKMTDSEKASVADAYEGLLEAVQKYNSDAADVNEAAGNVSPSLFKYTVVYSDALCYAVYSLLSKKYI